MTRRRGRPTRTYHLWWFQNGALRGVKVATFYQVDRHITWRAVNRTIAAFMTTTGHPLDQWILTARKKHKREEIRFAWTQEVRDGKWTRIALPINREVCSFSHV